MCLMGCGLEDEMIGLGGKSVRSECRGGRPVAVPTRSSTEKRMAPGEPAVKVLMTQQDQDRR
jgi:hypothetical protein